MTIVITNIQPAENIREVINIACRSPLIAWQHAYKKTKKGRALIVFSDKKRHEIDAAIKNWNQVEIPCGQCIECRLKRRHDWSQRLMLELPKWKNRYFLTLTYNDEHIPHSIIQPELTSLRKSDPQKFLKRLRAGNKYYHPGKLKYFMCGEYGETTARAHYHMIIFVNNPIPHLYEWSKSNGYVTYRSKAMESFWTIGNMLIGSVTHESCDYVARYIVKKQLGLAGQIYETNGIIPPYTAMSNGIGELSEQEILNLYRTDIVNIPKVDHVKTMKPAAYFDKKLREIDPDYYELIKEKRRENSILTRENKKAITGLSAEEITENEIRKKDKKLSLLQRSKI